MSPDAASGAAHFMAPKSGPIRISPLQCLPRQMEALPVVTWARMSPLGAPASKLPRGLRLGG
eukprot:13976725-Alexandrium_andersonii.AAC.1